MGGGSLHLFLENVGICGFRTTGRIERLRKERGKKNGGWGVGEISRQTERER